MTCVLQLALTPYAVKSVTRNHVYRLQHFLSRTRFLSCCQVAKVIAAQMRKQLQCRSQRSHNAFHVLQQIHRGWLLTYHQLILGLIGHFTQETSCGFFLRYFSSGCLSIIVVKLVLRGTVILMRLLTRNQYSLLQKPCSFFS